MSGWWLGAAAVAGVTAYAVTGDHAPAPMRWSYYAGPSQAVPAQGPIRVGLAGGASVPVASLDDALAKARALRAETPGRAIDIVLPPGVTRIETPLKIGPADSGTPGAPLQIRGAPNGSSVLSGGAIVAGGVRKGRAVVIDLARVWQGSRTLAGSAYNKGTEAALNPLIFQGGWKISLSAWPADGYLGGWALKPVAGGMLLAWPAGVTPPALPSAVLVSGYLIADWAFETVRGTPRADGIFLPGYKLDFPPKNTPKIRVLNVAGVPAAGNMKLDEATGTLTVVPSSTAAVEIARAPSLLVIEGAAQVGITALRFEKTTAAAIRITKSRNIMLDSCSVGQTGREGVIIADSRDVIVQRCVIRATGGTGIVASGGERTTLTSGNIVIRDTVIEQFGTEERAYRPAASLYGFGTRLEHSLVAVGPHAAIGLGGNELTVSATEIAYVACETNDVGAVYMGRDWTMRGNRVAGNFLHDIGIDEKGTQPIGVYLDDQFSGATITGNVFLRMMWGVLLGGGRDNRIDGNVFALMRGGAVHYDARGIVHQQDQVKPGGPFMTRLEASPFRTPAWRARYPTLATLPENHPGAPLGNTASNNLLVGSAWLKGSNAGYPMTGEVGRTSPVPGLLLKAISTARAYTLLAKQGGLAGPVPGPRGRLMFDRYRLATPNCEAAAP